MYPRGHHLNHRVQDYFTAVFRIAPPYLPFTFSAGMDEETRKQLRRDLRRQRCALDTPRQQSASDNLVRRLLVSTWFSESRHIAAYIAADGEPDLMPLITHASGCTKTWYLPAIDPAAPEQLVFRRYRPGDRLVSTDLGVLEPAPGAETVALSTLDLVLTPLVGFDAAANRMGMGKGFYDRTFAFKRETPDLRPWLVGVAHECQRVVRLEPAWWDVPLNGVMTPENCYVAGLSD